MRKKGGVNMSKEFTKIKPDCDCNFAFAECGENVDEHKTITIYTLDGNIIFNSRELNNIEADDLTMVCIRCGKDAWWTR